MGTNVRITTREKVDRQCASLLWKRVGYAKHISEIVDAAEIWMQVVWPRALKWGYTPKKKGSARTVDSAPSIRISDSVPKTTWAYFLPREDGTGTIYISTIERLKEIAAYHTDMSSWRDLLRWTIVHEFQHALDHGRGVYSGDHGNAYDRRFAKLLAAFPPGELR